MEFSNKLMIFIVGVQLISTSCLYARHEICVNEDGAGSSVDQPYRLATLKDVDAIDEIYKNMDPEDVEKLVYVPEPFRKGFIAEAVGKGRLFVAVVNHVIVGFIKIFIVDNHHIDSDGCFTELHNILHNELCCLGDTRELIQHGVYHISPDEVNSSSKRLSFSESSGDFIKKSNQIYIYYGCSYVIPDYRGKGVGTKLDSVAFGSLKRQIDHYVKEHQLHEVDLVFLYGQVADNANKQLPLRSFARFVHSFTHVKPKKTFDHSHFSFWSYRASKPIFCANLRTGNLDRIEIPRREWSDSGCVVSCSLAVNLEYHTHA